MYFILRTKRSTAMPLLDIKPKLNMENVDNQRKNGNAKNNVRHNNEPVRNVCANLAPSSNQANGDS